MREEAMDVDEPRPALSIKRLTISGFRSFRPLEEQIGSLMPGGGRTVSKKKKEDFQDWSEGQNVVIGRNGSGKSNVLDAVEFVLLGPRFYTLRYEERQRILHEGRPGLGVLSAFVEIVLRNPLGRVPLEGQELIIRRALGLKKDEFFVNRRRVTKKEVESLLETAGFNRSNPYYLVQQGQVQALCLMKESERLNLIKAVAGASAYESDKQLANTAISDAEEKRRKVIQVVQRLEARLSALEKEKQELQAYEQAVRRARELRAALATLKLQHAEAELATLDQAGNALAAEAHAAYARKRQADDNLESTKHALEHQLDALTAYRERTAAQNEAKAQRQVKYDALEAELKLLDTAISLDDRRRRTAERKLAEVRTESASIQSQLEEVEAQSSTMHISENQNPSTDDQDNTIAQAKHAVLSATRAAKECGQRFRKAVEAIEAQRKGPLATARTEAADSRIALNQASENTALASAKLRSARREKQRREDLLLAARSEMGEARRALVAIDHSTNISRTNSQLLMPRDVFAGLEAVEAMNEPGYHGPLAAQLRLVDEQYRAAIEAAAGPRLWHVLVDDDSTAATLLEHLEGNKSGRLSFIPINRLRASTDSQFGPHILKHPDLVPLRTAALELVTSEQDSRCPGLEKALSLVFGSTLLASSLDAATRVARDYDCVTLDGDRVSRRGVVTGGFRDPTRSALDAWNRFATAKEEFAQAQDELEASQAQLDAALQGATLADKALAEAEARRNAARRRHDAEQLEAAALAETARRLEAEKRTATHERLAAAHRTLHHLLSGDDSHGIEDEQQRQASLAHKLTHDLGKRELDLRQRLGFFVVTQSEQDDRMDITSPNDEYEDDVDSFDAREAEVRLDRRASTAAQLAALDLEQRAESDDVSPTTNTEAKLESQVNRARSTLARAREAAAELDEELSDVSSRLDQNAALQAEASEAREEAIRTLSRRALNAVELNPNDANRSLDELLAELEQCDNEGGAAVGRVNNKALDDFLGLQDQRRDLSKRLNELDHGRDAVTGLVTGLDARKDAAVERTFEAVASHFTQVFQELEPAGRARLSLIRKVPSLPSQDTDNPQDTAALTPGEETLVGVRVQVHFPGDHRQVAATAQDAVEQHELDQLSGGQKTIVALALLFALQRADPAPFYLFDEIDANLDATHRSALARLVHNQAHAQNNPAQFLTTTFHPELIHNADAFFGISLSGSATGHKASRLLPATKQDALTFVSRATATPLHGGATTSSKRPRSPSSTSASGAGDHRSMNLDDEDLRGE